MRGALGVLGLLLTWGAGAAQLPCTTSATSWPYNVFSAQRDSFTVEYDDTPATAALDGQFALSARVPASYTGLAVSVRFSSANLIDARNAGAYTALTPVSYTPGASYHFRLRVSVPRHRYSVWVTPAGGTEVRLADDYAFRTEQDTVKALNFWTAYSSASTRLHTVCNVTMHNLAADTLPTPPPPVDTTVVTWTAAGIQVPSLPSLRHFTLPIVLTLWSRPCYVINFTAPGTDSVVATTTACIHKP